MFLAPKRAIAGIALFTFFFAGLTPGQAPAFSDPAPRLSEFKLKFDGAAIFAGRPLLAQSTGGTALYALIANGPAQPGQNYLRLKYADDDVVKGYTMLSTFAQKILMLGEVDEETAQLYPWARERMKKTSLQNLITQIDHFNKAIEKGGKQKISVLLLWISAHADYDPHNKTAILRLADGPVERDEFYRKIVSRSQAARTHVILDVCLNCRTDAPSVEAAPKELGRALISIPFLEERSDVGVLAGVVRHIDGREWEGFGGGIFVHEARSAAVGAADINGNGVITYREVMAFIDTANSRVRKRDDKPVVIAYPPKKKFTAAIFTPKYRKGGMALKIPPGVMERIAVESTMGTRFVDLYSGGDTELNIALMPGREYAVFTRKGMAIMRKAEESTTNYKDLQFGPPNKESMVGLASLDECTKHGFFVAGHSSGEYTLYSPTVLYKTPKKKTAKRTLEEEPEEESKAFSAFFRWGGLILLIGGAGALGYGTYRAVKTGQNFADLDKRAKAMDELKDVVDEKNKLEKDLNTMAIMGLTGLICVVGGIIFLVIGMAAGSGGDAPLGEELKLNGPRWELEPLAIPYGAGLNLQVTF
jgi:hypothetical protein